MPNKSLLGVAGRLAPAVKILCGSKPSQPKKKGGQGGKGKGKGGKNQVVVDPTVCPYDMRVGEIQSVRVHPKADKLYILSVDVGEEVPRQICAGLLKHYSAGRWQPVLCALCLCVLHSVYPQECNRLHHSHVHALSPIGSLLLSRAYVVCVCVCVCVCVSAS
jgi:tRNA-binding EMAP/Myf-like protein